MREKADLRSKLRAARRKHVDEQPPAIRALLFNRPPAPLLKMVPEQAVIGLYHATHFEAPTQAYAKFFYERGHRIALPRFNDGEESMHFAEHCDPFGESDLIEGHGGTRQPAVEAEELTPDLLFVPLIGFTESGARLGQGGGHYDRFLAGHPETRAIGLAWDVQRVEMLPLEPHDRRLDAVVTPTRIYGPFA